jgi:REP element-mobilizing transposase RayT
MTSYDPHLHHRRSIRLKGYDYSQPGAYFITQVTWQRDCLFGEIIDGVMQLNSTGKIIQSEWQRLAFHFHNIKLDAFMVMPNHLHGTIVIDPVGATPKPPSVFNPVGATRQPPCETPDSNTPLPDRMTDSLDGSPLQKPSPSLTESLLQAPSRSGPIPNSLGAMIGQFKSRATKRVWSLPEMDHSLIWQRNYYEHIVRNDFEYKQIIQYIETNPLKWQEDQLHPSINVKLINKE